MQVKAMNEDARLIEGWATLAEMDRVGDVVLPRGASYELPLPFLLDHDHRKAVGEVDRVEVSDKGIKFWAHIKKIAEPGEVKDLCDTAWSLVKNGLRKAVSIGFSAKDFDILPNGGLKFTSWEWLELSAVTVPAAPGARITNIKSVAPQDRFTTISADIQNPSDREPAASGKTFATVRLQTPPASGKSATSSKPQEGSPLKISEKISRFEEKRAANTARIAAIHEETDESLNDAQLDEIKGLEAEIATIDRDLPSLKRVEADLAKNAKPVPRTAGIGDNGGPALQPTVGVSVKQVPKPEPGIRFARYVRCMAIAHKDHVDAARLAENLYGERDPVVVGMVKAAGTAVGAYNGTTDSALIGNEGGFADFVELLRNRSIVGRFGQNGIPALRGIPFRVPLISQVTSGGAYWVGEGDGKPVVKGTFGRTELAPLKIAAISVATMEVLRDSSPGAERLIRDDLAASIVERMDLSFIDPTNNGSAGVFPASITYGAEAIVSETYSDADDIRTDVRSLMQKFIDAKNPLTTGVWVMSASNALALSMIKNALGQAEFPAITINGGMFEGLPVIVSDHIGSYVALVNASDIWFGDEGGIQIDMSDQASLQMVGGDDDGSTQNSITPVATSMVSLWQTNSVGIRAERTLNWLRRRTSAVAYLSSVTWGGAVNAS
ncbi:phage major capsid protein [Reyranella sp.]|uniref:phage major capsid protein n=2 Tax=Reyranella sp. TaxID=1929291 RepID=UPI00261EA364|nr:phage major capsid protein [Reyranella sp.]